MPRKIDRRHGSGKIMIDGKAAIDPRTRGSRDPRKGNKYKYRMSGAPERSVNTQYEGAETFSGGGMCRGAGAAVKGKKFQGVF